MPSFKCQFCDEVHHELPMDLAYQRPPDVFDVPILERALRVTLTEDLCTIDNKRFYIRGVLALPVGRGVRGSRRRLRKEFSWGVWARVKKEVYDLYVELWHAKIPAQFRPLRGNLCGNLPCYPNSDGVALAIHLQSNGLRPRFKVLDRQHSLAIDQRKGITMEQVHVFVAPLLKNSHSGHSGHSGIKW